MGRRWVWWGAGLAVTIVVLAVLSHVLPVAMAVVAGWAAGGVVTAQRPSGRPAPSGPVLAVAPSAQVLLFVGLGLLLGAAGLAIGDDHGDARGAAATLGAVLSVTGAVTLLVLLVRARSRAVDAEVERHRRATEAALADDSTA